jgi:mono/diheme cytochrome c family protein
MPSNFIGKNVKSFSVTHHLRRARQLLVALTTLICLSTVAQDQKKHPITEIKIRKLDAAEAAKISYARQIKPLLTETCDECHSSDEHKGGFEITSVATLIKGGKKASPAIIPGKPDDSPLVQYLRGQREPQMPKGNPAVTEDELHLMRLWILAGAIDDSATVVSDQTSADTRAGRLRPNSPSQFANDPALQEALNTLLFSDDNNERLFAQRTIRLASLPKAAPAPDVQGPVFNDLDKFIVAKWQNDGLKEAQQPPSVCSDAVFLRRVYLDIIGAIPTVEEAQKFIADNSSDKRTKLVDELLARKEDYAAHWTPFWEEAIGSANVDKVGGIASRGNHRDWIYKSFLDNKPFDLFVAELIDPTLPGYRKPIISEANGKRVVAAYIRNETHVDTIQSAAAVGQVFLGTGMKCASCHNHFLNKEWPQARFLAFAGMFATNDLESIRCEKPSGKFIPAKFPFEIPGAPNDTPKEINQRLHRVAQLLIDPANPRFAKTIVNRLWKHYLGLGLFEPQDDFRLDHPPSHPELLAWLADDFMRHGYDLKHTIRLILTSRTYQLKYDPALEDHFDVNKTEQAARYYRSPSLRRLTAEQLLDSISVAMDQRLDSHHRLYLDKESTALTRALGRPAAHNEISTARPDDVAIVQALEILNGEEFYERIYSSSTADQLANQKDLAQAIDRLYWVALSRPASADERKLGAGFLKASLPEEVSLAEKPLEEVWLDDDLPPGAKASGTGGADAWKWITKSEGPVFSGERAHTQTGEGKQLQHYSIGATKPLRVGPDDILFTYVYLDPKTPPREIMMQWNNGDWEHRAFWGDDLIQYGAANTASRRRMGSLPKTGEWVRLEVPARQLGITSPTDFVGWSFDQPGGKVYWDKSGVIKNAKNPNREPVGDALWALFASPEFQYIR